MRIVNSLAWIGLVVFCCQVASSQQTSTNTPASEPVRLTLEPQNPTQGLFERGRYEFSFSNGSMFSPMIATGHRPTINYTMTEMQLGYMLSNVGGRTWGQGNFELLGEVLASWIFVGDGSWIAGGTLWGRYNFVQPDSRFVPFTQAGMGMVSTDITHKIDGQPFNFNLELGAGARYLFKEHWSANIEFRYQHISNANTGKHNLGVNGLGPIIGISYFF